MKYLIQARIVRISTVLLLASALASGKHPKIAEDLDVDGDGNADVIVQFTDQPSSRHHQMVQNHGGTHKADLGMAIKGGAYSIPRRALKTLADDPDVSYITPDRPVHGSLNYAIPAVNADIAQKYGWDGNGIGVAVLDSQALVTDPDLQGPSGASRVVYSKSMLKSGSDSYGHGTHVAGILAGDGTTAISKNYPAVYRGVAPRANIIGIKVLDATGAGTDSDLIAGIQQAIALKKIYNIRVMNLSLGRPVYESYTKDPLCQAVESAWKAGIVVVVAAGNEGRNNTAGTSGYATIASPDNDPYVITAGAMKTMGSPARGDDLIASYSSKGPTLIDHVAKPDLVAPGNRVVSWDYTSNLYKLYSANRVGPQYLMLSGTSMATPMVSGAAALLLGKSPSLTPDQVKAILMATASKAFPAASIVTDPVSHVTYTSQYDLFTIGAGYLDVWAALNYTSIPASGAATSPIAVYSSLNGTVSLVRDYSAVWGDSAVWETPVLFRYRRSGAQLCS